MKIYPLVDWVSTDGATLSGAGSAWNPTNAPISNGATSNLGSPARLNSSFLGKTFIDVDLGSARTLRGLSAVGVLSGSGATAVDLKYRILASSSATIVEQVAPTAATFTNYTNSPVIGDINDDPDSDDEEWPDYDGTGTSEVDADFGKTVADFAGSGSHTTTYVRILAGTTESTGDTTSHNLVVKVVNDTTAAEFTLDTVAVTTPSVDGGELVTVQLPYSTISGWTSTNDVHIVCQGAETSGDCAIVGAIRLYIPGQNIVTNGDTGWLDAWPTSYTGTEPRTQNSTVDCHGVFSADVSARYLRFWFDNSAASYVDVGRVLAGAAITPTYSYNHREGTSRQGEDTSVREFAESGQPYIRQGIRRKRYTWNLHFLTLAETRLLEDYFDAVKGLGDEFVVIPDEDTTTSYYFDAVYGLADTLEPTTLAGFYSGTNLRHQRTLTVREVRVD